MAKEHQDDNTVKTDKVVAGPSQDAMWICAAILYANGKWSGDERQRDSHWKNVHTIAGSLSGVANS